MSGEKWPAAWQSGVVCLVLSFVLFNASKTAADPDLYGQLRFGNDILRAGTPVLEEPYSFRSQGQPWLNTEWLTGVIGAVLYNAFGAPGVILFKAALSVLLVGLLYRHLCRKGLSVPAGAGVVLLAFVSLSVWLLPYRAQLFTYLGFLLVLLAIHQADHGHPRWLWWLPVVFAFWVNLHGGFLAGIAVLIAWFVGRTAWALIQAWHGQPLDVRRLATMGLAVVASGLSTLLNPEGLDRLLFLWRTVSVPRPEISDWSPLAVASVEGIVYLLLLVLVSACLISSVSRPDPVAVLLFFGLALGPLTAQRHLPLFTLGAVVLGADWLVAAERRLRARDVIESPPPRWMAAVPFVGAVLFVALSVPHWRGIDIHPGGALYPVRAVAMLKASGVRGNLIVHFDWGEYVIWWLGPDVKVSLDGRRETAYSDDAYREGMRFLSGVGDWDAQLRPKDADLALVSRSFAVFNLMKYQPDWVLVYEDPMCGLFARRGTRALEQLKETPLPDVPWDGAGMQFP
ncbi:MAG: hypothetical protein K2R98_10640 [Gemmataceae bacterium]|nr:hypothetical protein [Gemmataceae bacterium]